MECNLCSLKPQKISSSNLSSLHSLTLQSSLAPQPGCIPSHLVHPQRQLSNFSQHKPASVLAETTCVQHSSRLYRISGLNCWSGLVNAAGCVLRARQGWLQATRVHSKLSTNFRTSFDLSLGAVSMVSSSFFFLLLTCRKL